MNKAEKLFIILGQEINYILIPALLSVANLFGAGRIGNRVRVVLLRLSGFKIGHHTMIRSGICFSGDFAKLTIGQKTSINYGALIDLMDTISIGNVCQIGPHVSFITSSHVLKSDLKQRRVDVSAGPIVIEDYVWIGTNASILGNVTVGKGAVIAAGSLVNKDVPPNTVVAGIPAKVIKQL